MTAKKHILMEGWRFSPNSLAVLNQAYCLQMLRRPDVELYHRDVPFWTPTWTHVPGLLPPDQELQIKALREPPADLPLDASLRTAHPTLIQRTTARRSWCWIVTEYRTLEQARIADGRPVREALNTPGVGIITCSNWSREGLLRAGASPDNIRTISLGYEPTWYKPAEPGQRDEARRALGWEGRFVFLNVSTMTWNKGIAGLIQAFALVAQTHPEAILVLKGNNRTLESNPVLAQIMGALPLPMRTLVQQRIQYLGEYLPVSRLATMYHAADAYVAPYHGEGFNLPVLEAAACGLAVICTSGGSTDDFTTPEFCRRIQSRPQTAPQIEAQIGPGATLLQVDTDHLVHLMRDIIADQAFRDQARTAGPVYLKDRFTWERVTDQLLQAMVAD